MARNCLECAAPMKRVPLAAGVEVDCCDAHGIWLDVGELQAIVAHAERRHAAATSALPAAPPQPGVFDGVGRQLVSSAVSGAGFGVGTRVASVLVRKLFG